MINQKLLLTCARAATLSWKEKPALFRSLSSLANIYWCNKGHYRCGFPRKALSLYREMVFEGFVENSSTFSTVLSMCSCARFFREGHEVHCRAIVLGYMNVYIGSALVDLYLRMGHIDKGLRLFSTLQERNLAIWNVVLRGLSEVGRSKELGTMYDAMKLDGLDPNGLTFCYLIQGCGYERLLDGGMQLHCCVMKKGLVESNLFLANALVDFYSACGSVKDSRKSFEIIPLADVISWNSMVSVYATNGYSFDALAVFQAMQLWDKKPSSGSFLGFLKLSSKTKDSVLGKQIHCYILKLGFDTVLVRSALIDMYGKCGDIESSVSIFDSCPERTLECCNSLMTSLLRSDLLEDVIDLFGLMVDEKIGYDEVSLSSTLKALSVSLPAVSANVSLLHCSAIKSGFESDFSVSCSLIDAYSKCGEVRLSCQVFSQLSTSNVICFTSMISALARNGMGKECLEMLNVMIQNGIKPDKVTFLGVLMGCNHSGLVEEGRSVFDSMQKHHGLDPDRQHYACMVDLLGRAGLLHEAVQLLNETPWWDDFVIWSSMLRSCRVHLNEHIGKMAAKMLMDLETDNPSGWLQASNFYSDIGDFESMKECREIAIATKVRREIGRSLIEVRDHC